MDSALSNNEVLLYPKAILHFRQDGTKDVLKHMELISDTTWKSCVDLHYTPTHRKLQLPFTLHVLLKPRAGFWEKYWNYAKTCIVLGKEWSGIQFSFEETLETSFFF